MDVRLLQIGSSLFACMIVCVPCRLFFHFILLVLRLYRFHSSFVCMSCILLCPILSLFCASLFFPMSLHFLSCYPIFSNGVGQQSSAAFDASALPSLASGAFRYF